MALYPSFNSLEPYRMARCHLHGQVSPTPQRQGMQCVKGGRAPVDVPTPAGSLSRTLSANMVPPPQLTARTTGAKDRATSVSLGVPCCLPRLGGNLSPAGNVQVAVLVHIAGFLPPSSSVSGGQVLGRSHHDDPAHPGLPVYRMWSNLSLSTSVVWQHTPLITGYRSCRRGQRRGLRHTAPPHHARAATT